MSATGLCECGCGERTPLAPQTNTQRGWVRGEPLRFVNHHASRVQPVGVERTKAPWRERFEAKIERTDTCWIWRGTILKIGYGSCSYRHRATYAHRIAYEIYVGPIPRGLELDHLCRVTRCVNPAHLEPVTHAENMRRAKFVRLTPEIRDQICARHSKGESLRQIALSMGMGVSTVSAFAQGVSWR